MKNHFNDDEKAFTDMIFKNAGNQDLYGPGMNNEISRDIIDDRYGKIEVVKNEMITTRVDGNGTPYIYRERVGKILDCGHMASSLEEILGQCVLGHFVCHRCELHVCDICGAKVCLSCLRIKTNGTKICPMHNFFRRLLY